MTSHVPEAAGDLKGGGSSMEGAPAEVQSWIRTQGCVLLLWARSLDAPAPADSIRKTQIDRWTFSTEAPRAGHSHAPASLLTYNLEDQNTGAHSSRASGVHTRPEGAAGLSLPPCPGGL